MSSRIPSIPTRGRSCARSRASMRRSTSRCGQSKASRPTWWTYRLAAPSIPVAPSVSSAARGTPRRWRGSGRHRWPRAGSPRLGRSSKVPEATAEKLSQAWTTNDPLVSVSDLTVWFPVASGVLQRTVGHVHAVDGVDLEVRSGETVGLVGESGCGKSTLGRTLLRLIEPTSGTITFEGTDVTKLSRRGLKAARRDMQIIFQDSVGSLDPRMRVRDLVGEGLAIHGVPRNERAHRVADTLDRVGLGTETMRRYPHQFSGGQRQRIGSPGALVRGPTPG